MAFKTYDFRDQSELTGEQVQPGAPAQTGGFKVYDFRDDPSEPVAADDLSWADEAYNTILSAGTGVTTGVQAAGALAEIMGFGDTIRQSGKSATDFLTEKMDAPYQDALNKSWASLGEDAAWKDPRAWVELALAGVMTGADGDALRFTGSDRRLSAYTSMPPWPGSLGPELMTLELERDAKGQRLLARSAGGAPLELWRWTDESGAFSYLDTTGNWLEAWPPTDSRRAGPLPAAIRLRGPLTGPVLVPVVTTQGPMLRQQDLQSDTPSR